MTLKPIALAAALVAGLTLAETASAIALAITPHTGSVTTFTQGQTGQQVTFDFDFSGITTAAQVVNFHDVFLAFNTSYLTYDSISFTTKIVSAGNAGNDAYQSIDVGGTLGDYLAPPNAWTYNGTPNLGTGSLRIYQNSDADPLSSLLALQSPSFTAFSITFNVITAQLGNSAIVMIDDRSYTQFTGTNNQFDYKENDTPAYPALYVQNSITIVAETPVPAPLALMGLGLAIMGIRRRRPAAA